MFLLNFFVQSIAVVVTAVSMITASIFGGGSSVPGSSNQPPTTSVTSPTTEETPEPTTPEEPVTEEPVTEEPTSEAPVTEEPVTEEPVTEEPTSEEPTSEEPTSEEPVTEEPTTEEPVTEEPTTPEEPVTEPEPEGPLAYVGLGDSYAAMASWVVPSTGPRDCYRSTNNYAGVILDSGIVEGVDVSCSGAETDSITGPQYKPGQNGAAGRYLTPQMDALAEDTDVVTVTVGANDLGYYDVYLCFADANQNRTMSDCATYWAPIVSDRLEDLPAAMDTVYAAIEERSPNAQVITGGYMPAIQPGDTCSELTYISEQDRQWVMAFTNELNGVVSDAAARNGSAFVIPEESLTESGCSPSDSRYVNLFSISEGNYPMHPTPLGHQAMADAMLAEIQR